jgi:uncharacterized protein YraI
MSRFVIGNRVGSLARLVLVALGIAGGTIGLDQGAAAMGDSGLYRADKTTRMFASPDLRATVIERVPNGAVVSALGPAAGCGAEACVWGKIAFDGYQGWVVTKYFEAALPVSGTAIANEAINLRAAPSTDGAVRAVIPAGGKVILTGRQQDGFVSVKFGHKTGWVKGEFLAFYPAPEH